MLLFEALAKSGMWQHPLHDSIAIDEIVRERR